MFIFQNLTITKLAIIVTFDGVFSSVEPTGGAEAMAFVLITNFQTFIQQQVTDVLAACGNVIIGTLI